jgi:hypothetical protein
MKPRATSWVGSASCCTEGPARGGEAGEWWRDGGREVERWKAMAQAAVIEGHSRFTFFDVCIFVTASEGEELIVDIIGRHGERRRR